MARSIRFTKPERELIRGYVKNIVSRPVAIPKGVVKAATSVLERLDAAEAPLQPTQRDYLSVREALTAFQSVLDRRLVLPPNGAGPVFAVMQAKLKSLGLTREQCLLIAMQAGKQWQGNIKAQSLLNQAETLLHNASGATFDETDAVNLYDDAMGTDEL